MTKTISSLLSLVALSALMAGCGDYSTPKEKEPTEITTPTSTGVVSTILDSSKISEGMIIEDVTIPVVTSDKKSTATVILSEGTEFKDSNGNKLNNVTPKLELKQAIASSASNSNVIQKVQTEIKLTDAAGKKIIPTKKVKVKIKAPSNAKPGDKVKVSVPDGVGKATTQEKLVFVTVNADGFVSLTIVPEVFKNFRVIIIIEKITVTGAEGGN